MQEIQSEFEIYNDSNSMIKKLAHMDQYLSAPSKSTLHSDWEVLSALCKALKWFPKKPALHHVYSHQDDKPTKKEISIKEQLNVDANKLATTGLQMPDPKLHMPFDPDTKVQNDF